MFDWDKLRIFHAVAIAGSFTRGGESLNLSQSAVSRHIADLESRLGLPLFYRHARGLTLTEYGQTLYQSADDIATRMARAEALLHETSDGPKGPFKITTSHGLGSTWLIPRLHGFGLDYPDLQVSINLNDKLLNLDKQEADVAIRMGKNLGPSDHIQKKLLTLNFHLYASKRYIAKYGNPQSVSDLSEHILIAYPPNELGPFEDTQWIFSKVGIDPSELHKQGNKALLINSIYGVFRAVRSGCGIAALPDYITHDEPDIACILPEIHQPGQDVFLVYPEERKKSRKIKALKDFLVKKIAESRF